MAGRHRAASDGASRREEFQRRRTTRRRSRVRRAATALLVLGVLAATGAFAATRLLGCTSTTTLSVTTSPDIAPAIRQVADSIKDDSRGPVKGACTEITVTASPSDQVAQALAAGKTTSVGSPDVWIPDSSLWPGRVAAAAGGQSPLGRLESIAQSPVVVAMVRPAAKQQGWPDRQPSWTDVVASLGSSPVKFGIADPTRCAPSMLTLAGLRTLLGSGTEANLQLVAAARMLSSRMSATTDDVLSKLPQSPAEIQQTTAGRVGAFPYTEQGVWAYNHKKPAVPLVAVYPKEGSPFLDYPFTPVARAGVSQAEAGRLQDTAEKLHDRLLSDPGTVVLQDHGFRSIDRQAGVDATPANGVLPDAPKSLPPVEPASLGELQRLWTAANLSGRILTVLDVSGSMGEPVPGAPGKTRMDLAKQAILTALPLLREDTSVGVWNFSTKLDGGKDYKEIVPIRPLATVVGDASQRTVLNAATSKVTWKVGGGTGLYDTILAGFRVMSDGYQAGRINVLVVMTDGKNDDPGSVSRDRLVKTLKSEFDPKKPVTVIVVAFGPEVDAAEIKPIAAATHGQSYVTRDPRTITQVLLQAIFDAAASGG